MYFDSNQKDVADIAFYFQKGKLRGYNVSNAWEILEQSGGTYSWAYGTAWHGEEKDWAIIE